MTRAEFVQKGLETSISISGHAEYKDSGDDIVCAACSALSCTLLQCVLDAQSAGDAEIIYCNVTSGDVRLCFKAQPQTMEKTAAMLFTIRTGFELLADEYPEHVAVEVWRGE